MGNIIFLARHVLEDPLTTDFCKNLILPLTVGGLLLTYLVAGPLVASYIILLNFAQRFTLFIIWFSPLMYSIEGIHLRADAQKSGVGAATRVFCYSLMAYYLGKVCRGVLLSTFPSGTAHTVIQACYAVVIFVVGAYSFVMMRKVSAAAVEPVPQQGQTGNGGTGYRGKFKEACEQIIDEYDLTKREGEVFVLLAKGRTTDAIAERLVISPATAQTHVKSIYRKLGVRSRQTLMDMVEERAEEALKQQG